MPTLEDITPPRRDGETASPSSDDDIAIIEKRQPKKIPEKAPGEIAAVPVPSNADFGSLSRRP
ncbi:hypothetical protein A2U01_0086735 [Trifolium medium]|uniref:Uncharacterized protein n=1 Tax=Trifolium medium TaxID=97028 RepID=A0A392TY89_9FABA|nr:hypothetical protein [Trifolium medium]